MSAAAVGALAMLCGTPRCYYEELQLPLPARIAYAQSQSHVYGKL